MAQTIKIIMQDWKYTYYSYHKVFFTIADAPPEPDTPSAGPLLRLGCEEPPDQIQTIGDECPHNPQQAISREVMSDPEELPPGEWVFVKYEDQPPNIDRLTFVRVTDAYPAVNSNYPECSDIEFIYGWRIKYTIDVVVVGIYRMIDILPPLVPLLALVPVGVVLLLGGLAVGGAVVCQASALQTAQRIRRLKHGK